MFVLFESSAGYAVFKVLDENKISQVDNLFLEFQTPEKANKILKLQHFEKFSNTKEALAAATAVVEGKISKPLKRTLKKLLISDVQSTIMVADSKLGNAIKDKFSVQCINNSAVQELMRCIRQQSDELLIGVQKKEFTAMALGLAHSLSRYKLKFSPDKVDTMVVQAQNLLDDLDKELNNYVMRVREWYGWHFPEMGKIVTDNIAYVNVINIVGTRDNMVNADLSDILPLNIEEQVKEAAEISMGTEISEEDIMNIKFLCEEIISINNYRTSLSDYLKVRMMAIAPNLTVLIGETIGAKLIAHAGSLTNLAKHPSSTIQILGAEKALFRALKAKKDTPKYGIIYHAQLVGQASVKNKGRISRSLAAKAALATRVDAFGEESSFELGAMHKVKLEARLRLLEEGNLNRLSGTSKAKAKLQKYHVKSEVFTYKSELDNVQMKEEMKNESDEKVPDDQSAAETSIAEVKSEKKAKKKKRKNLDESEQQGEVPDEETAAETSIAEVKSEKKAKKKKRKNLDESEVSEKRIKLEDN